MTSKMYNIIYTCGLLILSSALTSTSLNDDILKSSPQRLAEGGELPTKPHLSREGVKDINRTITVPDILNNTKVTNETVSKTSGSKFNNTTKPIAEKVVEIASGVPKKNDDKQSVGKKGVSFGDIDSNVNASSNETSVLKTTSIPLVLKPKSSTTKAPIPKKPLITEHDDFKATDDKAAELKSDPKIPDIDIFLEKKSKRANYVIPIVAVILSVPLVAIVMSALYKRGTDWWQHRNYRRMDFLIEGMYNN